MPAGALAGFLRRAGARDIGFVRLHSPGRDFRQLGAREHATAYGSLAPNGMIWAERALGRDLGPESDCVAGELLPDLPTIVAINPNLLSASDLDSVRGLGRKVTIKVTRRGEEFVLSLESDGVAREIGVCSRDRYGRPILNLSETGPILQQFHAPGPTPVMTGAAAAADGPELVVVGERSYHRDVYPALLAALGDAGDALRQAPTIRFVSPRGLVMEDWPAKLAGADGVVLPGGPDTTQTAGQVDAAATTLHSGVPTLGICLGMQTMTTAFARRRAGLPAAGLEEIDADARPQIFTRMRDADGEGQHRLGARQLHVDPVSRLAGLLGSPIMTERLHHRYHLALDLEPVLAAAGLRLAARDSAAGIVDAVESPEHPFFLGLQCHVELSSRQDPHPVLTAFLLAAQARAGDRHSDRSPSSSHLGNRDTS